MCELVHCFSMAESYDMPEQPAIAMIGGGTGSFTLLQELKHCTPNIAALVNMSDDGGSSGRLRDELGVLPPGDVRQCLVALSDAPEARDVFSYRFGDGPFKGHSLGNIILSGLELRYGDFAQATKVASHILRITGRVIPVTLENHRLMMDDGDEKIAGEYLIGHHAIASSEPFVYLEPAACINPEAKEAIREADMVVIAPGNLYGSLLPALAVGGMAEALRQSSAQKIMVANLVTKPGQTDGWHVADYIRAMERYLGEGAIDVALYNTAVPSKDLLYKYAAEGEYPVDTSEARFSEVKAVPIGADLVAGEIFTPDPKDTAIRRTLVRHDAKRVSKELMRLYHE
jgi:uncharacterized cofD-like protein